MAESAFSEKKCPGALPFIVTVALLSTLLHGCMPDFSGLSGGGGAPLVAEAGMAGERPSHDPCTDGILDGAETDIDCGGQCTAKCGDGYNCAKGERDCTSGVCTAGVCAMPTCSDHVRNDHETDIDCGGGKCAQCQPQASCQKAEDCTSGVCTDALCDAALRVYYTTDTLGAKEIRVRPQISVTNGGMNPVELTRLSVRYYLTTAGEDAAQATTSEGTTNLTGVGGGDISNVTRWQVIAIAPIFKADTYAEIAFPTATVSLSPGETVSTVFSLSFADFAPLNQANDFSFDPAPNPDVPYDRITLHLDGSLIYGAPPGK